MKLRVVFVLFLLLLLSTACKNDMRPPASEATGGSTAEESLGVVSSAQLQTEPLETAPPTETVPIFESVPETEYVPAPTEPEPYLDVNAVGKTVVHVPGPADNRPVYDYSFQPYAFSSIYSMAYGESVADEIRGFCDAVLAGEDSFPCTGLENWLHIDQIKNDLLPICYYVSVYDPNIQSGFLYDESLLQNGRYPLYYQLPKEEFLAAVAQFKTRIAELISQADLREGDSDLEKAMKLYTASSLCIAYDYSDIGPNYVLRVLMDDYGICQEIAPAYAYLLLQVGVDAGTCGSLAKDNSFAHAWTIVKLDGKWYHADVTWQLSEPYSLRYFLIDDNDRDQSNLDVEYLNIGEINELWHKDLPIDDDSYSALWNVRWYEIDHARGCISYYDDPYLDYYDLSVYQLERKTFSLEK